MLTTFAILNFVSATAFIGYGVACLATDHMVEEFERFGLGPFRRLVGALELLGGLGLFIGWYYRPLLALAAAGLTALMILGVWTRVRIKDTAAETLPAAAFLCVNAYLAWVAFR